MDSDAFFSQILPNMVREAYALLRQSIIHVEQDDIDFEEDDEEMADAAGILGNGNGNAQDVAMEDLQDDDESQFPHSANASSLLHGNTTSSEQQPTAIDGVATATTTGSPAARRTAAQSVQPDGEGDGTPAPALAAPKKKLRITCELQHAGCSGSALTFCLDSQQVHGDHEPLVS
jgi:hypothetical protein